VARLAAESGAGLVLNSDAHSPADFLPETLARKVVQGAGLPTTGLQDLLGNARRLLDRIGFGC
jgi:histidinol phosphatase-like PHP family hydrolase